MPKTYTIDELKALEDEEVTYNVKIPISKNEDVHFQEPIYVQSAFFNNGVVGLIWDKVESEEKESTTNHNLSNGKFVDFSPSIFITGFRFDPDENAVSLSIIGDIGSNLETGEYYQITP